MSSHHVIRENQEAAVAILTTENCSFEILGEALEWSPLVMATAEVSVQLIQRGFKIDLVLGTSTNEVDQILQEQRHINVKEKSVNQLNQVIEFAKENSHPAIIIFTAFDEKTTGQIAQSPLPICIIDGVKKWTFIDSGKFKKWFAKGDTFQLKANNTVLTSNGNKAKFTNVVEEDGIVSLKSKSPFWLGESLI